jgi:hypothetical protein
LGEACGVAAEHPLARSVEKREPLLVGDCAELEVLLLRRVRPAVGVQRDDERVALVLSYPVGTLKIYGSFATTDPSSGPASMCVVVPPSPLPPPPSLAALLPPLLLEHAPVD